MLKSRDVFVWKMEDHDYASRSNYHTDTKLLERSGYQIVDAEVMSREDAVRLRDLYRGLYLKVHNILNAWLTEAFFELSFKTGILKYRLLVKDGQIDAFYNFCIFKGVYIAVVLGYDLTIPRKEGLYRSRL